MTRYNAGMKLMLASLLILGTASAVLAQPPVPVWTEEGRAAARAATVPAATESTDELPAPDPTDDPAEAVQFLRDTYAQGNRLLLVVAFLWMVARVAYVSRERWSWLNTPRRRALVTGAVSVLAALLASLAVGAFDAAALLTAVGAAVALYLTPEPKPPAAGAVS